jgi:hypothetical protein
METNIYTREYLENMTHTMSYMNSEKDTDFLLKNRTYLITYVAGVVASFCSSRARKERGTRVLEVFDFVNDEIKRGIIRGVEQITLEEYFNILQCLNLSSMILINNGVIKAQCHSCAYGVWQGD